MKKITILFCIIFVFLSIVEIAYTAEFRWARLKFKVIEPFQEDWDCNLSGDLAMLKELEKYTTIKPKHKIYTASFKNLKQASKFPIIFMHASGAPKFSEDEKKNMKEYLLRGGFLFVDDCIDYGKRNPLFRGAKKLFEDMFGKSMDPIPINHEIYHCHFDLWKGMPIVIGIFGGGYGLYDDKKRLMVFLTSADIHCGWAPGANLKLSESKRMDVFKISINLIVYALTH